MAKLSSTIFNCLPFSALVLTLTCSSGGGTRVLVDVHFGQLSLIINFFLTGVIVLAFQLSRLAEVIKRVPLHAHLLQYLVLAFSKPPDHSKLLAWFSNTTVKLMEVLAGG